MSAPALLPDLVGIVHGIKSMSPWTLQCDGCRKVIVKPAGVALIVFLRRMQFLNYGSGDHRRMCTACWAAEGIHDD